MVNLFFDIIKCDNDKTWFLILDSNKIGENYLCGDSEIADKLQISYEDYITVLKRHNACVLSNNKQYYFKRKKDILICVEELEKYLIMIKIIGD